MEITLFILFFIKITSSFTLECYSSNRLSSQSCNKSDEGFCYSMKSFNDKSGVTFSYGCGGLLCHETGLKLTCYKGKTVVIKCCSTDHCNTNISNTPDKNLFNATDKFDLESVEVCTNTTSFLKNGSIISTSIQCYDRNNGVGSRVDGGSKDGGSGKGDGGEVKGDGGEVKGDGDDGGIDMSSGENKETNPSFLNICSKATRTKNNKMYNDKNKNNNNNNNNDKNINNNNNKNDSSFYTSKDVNITCFKRNTSTETYEVNCLSICHGDKCHNNNWNNNNNKNVNKLNNNNLNKLEKNKKIQIKTTTTTTTTTTANIIASTTQSTNITPKASPILLSKPIIPHKTTISMNKNGGKKEINNLKFNQKTPLPTTPFSDEIMKLTTAEELKFKSSSAPGQPIRAHSHNSKNESSKNSTSKNSTSKNNPSINNSSGKNGISAGMLVGVLFLLSFGVVVFGVGGKKLYDVHVKKRINYSYSQLNVDVVVEDDADDVGLLQP